MPALHWDRSYNKDEIEIMVSRIEYEAGKSEERSQGSGAAKNQESVRDSPLVTVILPESAGSLALAVLFLEILHDQNNRIFFFLTL